MNLLAHGMMPSTNELHDGFEMRLPTLNKYGHAVDHHVAMYSHMLTQPRLRYGAALMTFWAGTFLLLSTSAVIAIKLLEVYWIMTMYVLLTQNDSLQLLSILRKHCRDL